MELDLPAQTVYVPEVDEAREVAVQRWKVRIARHIVKRLLA